MYHTLYFLQTQYITIKLSLFSVHLRGQVPNEGMLLYSLLTLVFVYSFFVWRPLPFVLSHTLLIYPLFYLPTDVPTYLIGVSN